LTLFWDRQKHGGDVRVASAVYGSVGVIFVLLLLGTIFGNADLATPGPETLAGLLPGSWRLWVGLFCLLAAAFLTAAWISLRALPGASWLALLVYLILVLPYVAIPGLIASGELLMVVALVLVIGIPIGVAAIAAAIGRAVARRRAEA
jgi:hypothetical protein